GSTVSLPASDFTYTGISGTTYAASSTPPTAAGSYQVAASFPAVTNYAADTATGDFSISPATPAVSVTDTGWTYGQSAVAPVAKENGSTVSLPASDFTYTGISGTTY